MIVWFVRTRIIRCGGGSKRFFNEIAKRRNDSELLSAIRGVYKEDGDENNINDKINSLRTLPAYEVLKNIKEIKREIVEGRNDKKEKAYDGIIIKYKQGKNMFKFFKNGLMNLWKVNRDLRKTVFNGKRYLIDYSRADIKQGYKFIIARKDFDKLVDELSERVSLIKVEYDNGKRDIKEFLNENEKEVLLNRREYIEIVRDYENFYKLPLFGALFILLEELSFPIVYLFPWMLPSTCVLPGMLEKRFNERRIKGIAKLKESIMKEKNVDDEVEAERICQEYIQDVAMNKISGYSVGSTHPERVGALCDVLGCRGTTAAALQQHQRHVLVDDWLVTCGGGVAVLRDAEVAHACVARGLWLEGDAATAATAAAARSLRQRLENWLVVRFINAAR